MAQKASPNLLRHKLKPWKSEWFGDTDYSNLIGQEIEIRTLLSYIYYSIKCPVNSIQIKRLHYGYFMVMVSVFIPDDERRRFYVVHKLKKKKNIIKKFKSYPGLVHYRRKKKKHARKGLFRPDKFTRKKVDASRYRIMFSAYYALLIYKFSKVSSKGISASNCFRKCYLRYLTSYFRNLYNIKINGLNKLIKPLIFVTVNTSFLINVNSLFISRKLIKKQNLPKYSTIKKNNLRALLSKVSLNSNNDLRFFCLFYMVLCLGKLSIKGQSAERHTRLKLLKHIIYQSFKLIQNNNNISYKLISQFLDQLRKGNMLRIASAKKYYMKKSLQKYRIRSSRLNWIKHTINKNSYKLLVIVNSVKHKLRKFALWFLSSVLCKQYRTRLRLVNYLYNYVQIRKYEALSSRFNNKYLRYLYLNTLHKCNYFNPTSIINLLLINRSLIRKAVEFHSVIATTNKNRKFKPLKICKFVTKKYVSKLKFNFRKKNRNKKLYKTSANGSTKVEKQIRINKHNKDKNKYHIKGKNKQSRHIENRKDNKKQKYSNFNNKKVIKGNSRFLKSLLMRQGRKVYKKRIKLISSETHLLAKSVCNRTRSRFALKSYFKISALRKLFKKTGFSRSTTKDKTRGAILKYIYQKKTLSNLIDRNIVLRLLQHSRFQDLAVISNISRNTKKKKKKKTIVFQTGKRVGFYHRSLIQRKIQNLKKQKYKRKRDRQIKNAKSLRYDAEQGIFATVLKQFNYSLTYILKLKYSKKVLFLPNYFWRERPLILSAQLVAQHISYELSKGVPLNEIFNDITYWFRVTQKRKKGFKRTSIFQGSFKRNVLHIRGYKIVCYGRPFGSRRTRKFTRFKSCMPTRIFNAIIDYSMTHGYNRHGALGIKVWLLFEKSPVRQHNLSTLILR